jgi:uridine phosphorylase
MNSIFDCLSASQGKSYITPYSDLISQGVDTNEDLGEDCIVVFSFAIFQKITESIKDYKCNFEWKFKTTYLESFQNPISQKRFCIHFPSYGASRIANSLEQLTQLGIKNFYGVGLAGGIQDFLEIDDIILLEGSVRGDGVSRYYVPSEFPSVPSFLLTEEVRLKLDSTSEKYYLGLSFGTDAFYRENIDLINHLRKLGVLSVDLESSAFFSVARSLGIKACWIGVISDLLSGDSHEGIAHSESVTDSLMKICNYLLDLVGYEQVL